jgi:peroxiredoxin
LRSPLPWIVAAIVIGVAAVVLVPLFGPQSQRIAGPAGTVGRSAPSFAMRDDRGAVVSVAQYRGKVVLMNLWASWCPPCREEMPDLERLFARDSARGLVVIGVDQGESSERARDFARALGVRYPIWIDSGQEYGRAYAALGLPTTIVVNRKGVVVRGFDGPLTYQQMQETVTPLLSART